MKWLALLPVAFMAACTGGPVPTPAEEPCPVLELHPEGPKLLYVRMIRQLPEKEQGGGYIQAVVEDTTSGERFHISGYWAAEPGEEFYVTEEARVQ